MLTAEQIEPTFPDLTDPDVESALALVHQRFSTNTFPSWPLAHPYRYVAHNGEINTLRGNINWMRAREGLLRVGRARRRLQEDPADHPRGRQRHGDLRQRARVPGDDRAVAAARDPDDDSRSRGRAHESMRPELKAFYEYHSSLMEPWDGPASIAFTDGTRHRRGARSQRPASVALLRDQGRPGHHGVGGRRARHPARGHRAQGAAAPGRIFLVDTAQGRIVSDEEIKRELAAAQPYATWLARTWSTSKICRPAPYLPPPSHETVLQRQQTFGYTHEDLRLLLAPMATNGEEAIGSMGTDTRSRCCRIGRGCSTTISSSCSRRSPTRRSTRSARSW